MKRLILFFLLGMGPLRSEAPPAATPRAIPEMDGLRFENLSLKFEKAANEMVRIQAEAEALAKRVCAEAGIDKPEECELHWQERTVRRKPGQSRPAKPEAK